MRYVFISPHVNESSQVLDSEFDAVYSDFQILDSGFSQWNVDFRFQSFLGLLIRIPQEKQIPKFWIPQATISFFSHIKIKNGIGKWSFL